MLDGEEQGLKLIILQSIGTKNIFFPKINQKSKKVTKPSIQSEAKGFKFPLAKPKQKIWINLRFMKQGVQMKKMWHPILLIRSEMDMIYMHLLVSN